MQRQSRKHICASCAASALANNPWTIVDKRAEVPEVDRLIESVERAVGALVEYVRATPESDIQKVLVCVVRASGSLVEILSKRAGVEVSKPQGLFAKMQSVAGGDT